MSYSEFPKGASMEGVFTAIVTPFNKNGSIDKESFASLVKVQEQAEIDGLVIGGTTGEGWALSLDEVEELYKTARCHFSKKIALGTGAISTKDMVEKTAHAKKLGADAALVVVPSYNLAPEEGIVDYFKAAASTGIEIIAYHHPKRTGLFLSLSCLVDIANIKGVVGIKDASGDDGYYKELAKHTTLFIGNDDEILKGKELGAKGIISVISNAFPRETKEIFEAKSKILPSFFKDLLENLYIETNPLGIKALLAEKKWIENFVRAPLRPLSAKGIELIKEMLTQSFHKEIANK